MATERRFPSHPQSAPGDFYVVNHECLGCGAPHVVAPGLIGWADDSGYAHCIWKKQPETEAELEQAVAAFDVSDIGCHRYAGNDPLIMRRIGADYCDHAPVTVPLPRESPPAEFNPTLIGDDHSAIARFLLALLMTPVLAFLLRLLARYL